MPSKGAGSSPIRMLLNLAYSRSPGPSPSFGGPHVLLAFLTLTGSSYIGREQLAERTGLGKGAVRTVLKKLKAKGYVDVIRSGCFLTKAGKKLSASIGSTMSDIVSVPRSDLTVGDHQCAIALRDMGKAVRSGIEQRDSAIRIGASGATTYIIRAGRFTVPGGSPDCERDFPGPTWPILREGLRPKNCDVVILCGGADEVSSHLGVLAAASTLL